MNQTKSTLLDKSASKINKSSKLEITSNNLKSNFIFNQNSLKLVESKTSLIFNDSVSCEDTCDASMTKIMDRYSERNRINQPDSDLSITNSDETLLDEEDSYILDVPFADLTKINQHKILLKKIKSDPDQNKKIKVVNNNNNAFSKDTLKMNSSCISRQTEASLRSVSSTDLSFLAKTEIRSKCGPKSKKVKSIETSSEIYKNCLVKCLKNNVLPKKKTDCTDSVLDNNSEILSAKSQLINLMKKYQLYCEDQAKENSSCIGRISLNESLSIFRINDKASDKPNLPCYYKENLDRIASEINRFNPFDGQFCKEKKDYKNFDLDNILTNPSILFCDEPTSGLDTYTASIIIDILEAQSRAGKIILCSIHQPSSQIYQKFNKLCLLSEGRIAFFGPRQHALRYFENYGYYCPINYNPSDYLVSILHVGVNDRDHDLLRINEILDQYQTSEYYSHIVEYLNLLHLDQSSEDQDQSSFTLIKR
ncbi:unnamed protein product [Brachionus calyciflorus]|uniref:ABC transporter family G domain-containing protein n=1 Tax=Brachionus calyciflorus TaxID=104777 RepID=A0A813WNJ3_9BILA|nr:unnamed protein product [Brachionus calyciflorus]